MRPGVGRLDELDAARVGEGAEREAGGRVDLDALPEGRRPEAPAAVDRGLGRGQCRDRDALRHGVGEVVLDQPAQQAAAPVGGAGGDVGDHPQRQQLPAGVERLVEAGVRRHRHRAGAELALGQPRAADDDLVGAVVVDPAGRSARPRDGGRGSRAARRRSSRGAGRPPRRSRRRSRGSRSRSPPRHASERAACGPRVFRASARSDEAAAPRPGPTRSARRPPWRPGRGSAPAPWRRPGRPGSGGSARARKPRPSSAHQVVAAATATTAAAATSDEEGVEVAGALVAEPHRQRALAGDGVGGDVAQVVGDEDRAGERADADAGVEGGPLPRLGLDVGRADDRDQAEEDEDHHLAEAEVAVGLARRRCRTRRRPRTPRRPRRSHHAVVAARTSPADGRHAEGGEGGGLHGARGRRSRADEPHRADPVGVGAADAVGVVVGVVDADLQGEADHQGEQRPSTTPPRRRTPRRRCRRARARRRRGGCAGGRRRASQRRRSPVDSGSGASAAGLGGLVAGGRRGASAARGAGACVGQDVGRDVLLEEAARGVRGDGWRPPRRR